MCALNGSNFRFAGQYYDGETGLHHNYHRYYDPKTGRYITPDPIGLDGGINLFAYAYNNPANLIDPLGLASAGQLGIGNPGSYGGENACENIYDEGIWDLYRRFLWEEFVTLPDQMWNGLIEAFNWPNNHPDQALMVVAGGELAPFVLKYANQPWRFGDFKSQTRWQNQMTNRGWTSEKITEAIKKGQRFNAENLVNKGNSASRFVHPESGRSVVRDNVTGEIIHVGGEGFRY